MTDDFEPTTEPTPEPEPTPDYIELDGRRFTQAQLSPYVRFMDWAKSNPQGFDDLEAWERGDKVMVAKEQVQPSPAPASTELDDDFLSPALKEELKASRDFRQAWYSEREAERKAAIDAGTQRFFAQYGDMSPDEVQEVLRTARDNEMIRIQLSRAPHDKVQAVEVALKQAMMLAFPDRAEQKIHDKVVTDLAAKRKAAAATGTSVSAPRVEQEPEDPHQAMIEEIRAAMNEAN
jgi:hypothetical protein